MPNAPESEPAESAAGQAERLRRLAMVAERSSNAVVLADAQRTMVWVNSAFTAITGLTEQESLGQRLGILLARGNADPAVFAQFTDAVAHGRGLKREIHIHATNGDARWALIDLQPIHDEAGAVSGWVLVATDLTDVRSQQQMLSLAVDGAGLGTWQWQEVAPT